MNIRAFATSIRFALSGLRHVFVHEQNFRVQVASSVVIVICMFLFPLTHAERILVLLLILLVLVLELINTAIEAFTDIVKPRLHSQVKIVKDIMAGTVFIASLGAAILGLMIFVPHIVELIAQKWYTI